MSEDEKEAIKQLKSWREYIIKNRQKVNKASDIEFYLRTALNLIKKQETEIEKKDKIIDKMAKYIVDLIRYYNPEEIRDVEEIKQYFKEKVEE